MQGLFFDRLIFLVAGEIFGPQAGGGSKFGSEGVTLSNTNCAKLLSFCFWVGWAGLAWTGKRG
jgi:hypothetical protein